MKVERLDVYDFKLHLTTDEFADLLKYSTVVGISLEVILQMWLDDSLDEAFQDTTREE